MDFKSNKKRVTFQGKDFLEGMNFDHPYQVQSLNSERKETQFKIN